MSVSGTREYYGSTEASSSDVPPPTSQRTSKLDVGVDPFIWPQQSDVAVDHATVFVLIASLSLIQHRHYLSPLLTF